MDLIALWQSQYTDLIPICGIWIGQPQRSKRGQNGTQEDGVPDKLQLQLGML